MSKSLKAALLSALLFPGTGHFFLKKYIMASLLAGTAIASLYLIASNIVAQAMQISDKIQSGDMPLDVTAITELVSKQTTGTEAQQLNMAMAAFIIVWLISIVDAYRLGRAYEKD